MEFYIYRCPNCQFIHQVPAYWVSFSPEKTFEFPHMNLVAGEMCENMELVLDES